MKVFIISLELIYTRESRCQLSELRSKTEFDKTYISSPIFPAPQEISGIRKLKYSSILSLLLKFKVHYGGKMSNRKGICGLRSIAENNDEEFLSKRWEDFDHSQKVGLGVWGSAWTVKDRKTSTEYVLQSCHQSEWTLARLRLLELARQRADLFVAPKYMFFRSETTYVCSNIAGLCLAEFIDGTIAIQEIQAAAIIKQVPSSIHCHSKYTEMVVVDSCTANCKCTRYLLRCESFECVYLPKRT